MAMSAKEYLELTAMWEDTPKSVVANNVNMLFGYCDGYKISSPLNCRTRILCAITGTAKYTVLAWMNCHREEVKIPLHKLCVIAEVFDVDIQNLMSKDDSWYKNDWELRSRLENKAEELRSSVGAD